jgi:aminomuconate-semialdehyde/2-hydroxymuconate-6-semialdehyde dehydrogenase
MAHKDITVRQLPNFINGEFVTTDDVFDVLYPITGEVTAQAHRAGQEQVDAAVAAARAALDGPWGALTQQERSDMMRAIAAGVLGRS